MDRLAMVFGKRVRVLRQRRKWTQEQLAKATGLGPKHVGVIERGEKSSSFEAIEKIAKALQVEYHELFLPHQRATEAIEKEIGPLLRDATRINPSHLQEFLKALRSALKRLDSKTT